MNRLQMTVPAVGLLLVGAFVSLQTFAASCLSTQRPFPSVTPSQDSVLLSCNGNTVKGTHAAQQDSAGRSVAALLTLGGAGKEAITFGVDINSQPMSACSVLDSGPADGNSKKDTTGCGPAIKWQARLNF